MATCIAIRDCGADATASICVKLAWFAASAIPRLRSCDNTKRGLTYQFFFFAFMEVAWFAIGVASAVGPLIKFCTSLNAQCHPAQVVVATRKAKINVPGISDNLIDRALSATGESTAYKDNDPSVA